MWERRSELNICHESYTFQLAQKSMLVIKHSPHVSFNSINFQFVFFLLALSHFLTTSPATSISFYFFLCGFRWRSRDKLLFFASSLALTYWNEHFFLLLFDLNLQQPWAIIICQRNDLLLKYRWRGAEREILILSRIRRFAVN